MHRIIIAAIATALLALPVAAQAEEKKGVEPPKRNPATRTVRHSCEPWPGCTYTGEERLRSAAVPRVQKDQCASAKSNSRNYAACRKAVVLGGGTAGMISVCSGGYWWTGGWGGWTQGGACSPEGATR
jgi:hypothetical protein